MQLLKYKYLIFHMEKEIIVRVKIYLEFNMEVYIYNSPVLSILLSQNSIYYYSYFSRVKETYGFFNKILQPHVNIYFNSRQQE